MFGLILLIAALVVFVLATVAVPVPRVQLIPLGLALLTASMLVGRVG